MDTPDTKPFMTEARAASCTSPRFLMGIIILGLGVILLLNRLHIIEAETSFKFLPLAPITIGLAKLILPGSRTSRVGGAVWLIVGCLLQAYTLQVFRLDFELLWPLLLVTLGAWIVYRAVARSNPRSRATGDAGDSFSVFSMMAGVERKSSSRAFRGGDATVIMGGCEIDLRDAQASDEGASIDVFALWGGIEIMVPGDWSVTVTATPIMGGIEDARKTVGSDPTKRLVIKGLVLMGGVEIRN